MIKKMLKNPVVNVEVEKLNQNEFVILDECSPTIRRVK
jgi:hypothetical protein